MINYDEIVDNYKTLLGTDGIESAESYLNTVFDGATVPEEVSKEIEVYLMRNNDASESNETVTPDESVTDEQAPVEAVEAE